ncbi:hypothetical protein BV911_11390 [Pseudoruegeria sp. SK021]|nr:hypothetical protein BV911_11390 [Pseudoruegeria sp. SK021]
MSWRHEVGGCRAIQAPGPPLKPGIQPFIKISGLAMFVTTKASGENGGCNRPKLPDSVIPRKDLGFAPQRNKGMLVSKTDRDMRD